MSKNSKSNQPDPIELAVSLMETMARDNLKDFFDFFRKDYGDTLDLSKGYELLDEELCFYVPQNQLDMKNAFTLFVKTTNASGKPVRFIIHTIWKGLTEILVGIAEVPDSVVKSFYPRLGMN